MSFYIPLPICEIDSQGKVLSANDYISEVFLYDGIVGADIFTLTGVKVTELYSSLETNINPLIERNDKIFKMVVYKEDENQDTNLTIMFYDVTKLEDLKSRYNSERPCIAKIQIDNYDQFVEETGSSSNVAFFGEIDKIIRKWCSKTNGTLARVKSSKYVMWFEQQYLDKLIQEKFELLDEVRSLETGEDFPASLSIGIGAYGKTLMQSEEYADTALDLALGRGGDQVVIKRNSKIEYYGGTLQTVEKRNKGKSRIVGHALKQLIEQSKRVFIMGHRNPDMDSFGAALGVSRLCMLSEKETYIVLDDINESLQTIYKQAKETDDYQFINSEKATMLSDKDSLVIVLDTHRPSIVQTPKLLDICERIVVIDHHRKVEEFIENPVLLYMESYASSTSELVAEILQYMINKKELTKLEAEALLAGMIVDTNYFGVKTGVRTFEAAAWIRRQGADTAEVKRFFQEDFESIKLKAKAISESILLENGVAITRCDGERIDAQLLCAQIADELLTVKGVKASFAVAKNSEDKTVISARSLGDVNVQVVMEKFGGGGHLTTAAAQVDEPIDEIIKKITELMEVSKQ